MIITPSLANCVSHQSDCLCSAALVESEAYLRHPCGTQFYLVVSRLIALHVATWPLNVKRCQCPRDFRMRQEEAAGGRQEEPGQLQFVSSSSPRKTACIARTLSCHVEFMQIADACSQLALPLFPSLLPLSYSNPCGCHERCTCSSLLNVNSLWPTAHL